MSEPFPLPRVTFRPTDTDRLDKLQPAAKVVLEALVDRYDEENPTTFWMKRYIDILTKALK